MLYLSPQNTHTHTHTPTHMHTHSSFIHSFQYQTPSTPRRPSPSVPQMKLSMQWKSRKMWMSVSSTWPSCASTHALTSRAPIAVAAARVTSCSRTENPVHQVLKLTMDGCFTHQLSDLNHKVFIVHFWPKIKLGKLHDWRAPGRCNQNAT